MNGTIEDVLIGLNRQWGEAYVSAMEANETLAQMQSQFEAMAKHATRMMTFATVCAGIGFALAVVTVALLIYRNIR